MLFVEASFFAFFAVVFAGAWTLRANGARKLWLLAASYLFYAAWDWRFCGLIALSTAIDFVVAPRIAASRGRPASRRWLALSLALNLGILFTFKYLDFFAGSAAVFLERLGLEVSWTTLQWTLPVGISFFTFQSMSYSIDVHRGVLAPRRQLVDFALFVAFFPQLVAGPIVRARHFLPQLDAARRFEAVPVRACLALFWFGFVKKACIGDNLASWSIRSSPSRCCTPPARRSRPSGCTPRRSTATSRATRTWRSPAPGSSASRCRATSTAPVPLACRSPSSGGAGTSRSRAGCGTTCTSRSAGIAGGVGARTRT